MNNAISTVEALLELATKQILIFAKVYSGIITYNSEKEIPKIFRIDQLPSNGFPPHIDITLVTMLRCYLSKKYFLGEIVFHNADGTWGDSYLSWNQFPINTHSELGIIETEVLPFFEKENWDPSINPVCVYWKFEADLSNDPLYYDKFKNSSFVSLDPYDPRLMIYYTYLSGRIREQIKRTKNEAWENMENRLNGFIRAGIPKLIH